MKTDWEYPKIPRDWTATYNILQSPAPVRFAIYDSLEGLWAKDPEGEEWTMKKEHAFVFESITDALNAVAYDARENPSSTYKAVKVTKKSVELPELDEEV